MSRAPGRSSRRLVLDNCEHLLQPRAELIDVVLLAGSEVRIVGTSREPIRVDGKPSGGCRHGRSHTPGAPARRDQVASEASHWRSWVVRLNRHADALTA